MIATYKQTILTALGTALATISMATSAQASQVCSDAYSEKVKNTVESSYFEDIRNNARFDEFPRHYNSKTGVMLALPFYMTSVAINSIFFIPTSRDQRHKELVFMSTMADLTANRETDETKALEAELYQEIAFKFGDTFGLEHVQTALKTLNEGNVFCPERNFFLPTEEGSKFLQNKGLKNIQELSAKLSDDKVIKEFWSNKAHYTMYRAPAPVTKWEVLLRITKTLKH